MTWWWTVLGPWPTGPPLPGAPQDHPGRRVPPIFFTTTLVAPPAKSLAAAAFSSTIFKIIFCAVSTPFVARPHHLGASNAGPSACRPGFVVPWMYLICDPPLPIILPTSDATDSGILTCTCLGAWMGGGET